MIETLKLGTRGSLLARTQSQWVADHLSAATGLPVELVIIQTRGDRVQDRPLAAIGGKGLFTLELEQALREGRIHLAVHSLKDLPTDDPEGLTLGAIPAREDVRDVLVGGPLDALPEGAIVGTGSLRREVQLRDLRPDLEIRGIRGNVDTRLRKLREGPYQAIVLAAAGLRRLGLWPADAAPLDPDRFLPAPGQGALGVQCAADNAEVLGLLAKIDDPATRTCVRAERSFLASIGGGCNVPAAAWATLDGGQLTLRAALGRDGAIGRVALEGAAADAGALGLKAADALRR